MGTVEIIRMVKIGRDQECLEGIVVDLTIDLATYYQALYHSNSYGIAFQQQDFWKHPTFVCGISIDRVLE